MNQADLPDSNTVLPVPGFIEDEDGGDQLPSPHDARRSPSAPTQPPRPLQLSPKTRITWLGVGCIAPLILLVISFYPHAPILNSAWQSGVRGYAIMLLKPQAWLYFSPALLFSMFSLVSIVCLPRLAHNLLLRVGIYTGVVLALQFAVIMLIVAQLWMLSAASIMWIGWYGVPYVVDVLRRGNGQFKLRDLAVAVSVIAPVLMVIPEIHFSHITEMNYLPIEIVLFLLIAGCVIGILLAVPVLNLAVYLHAALSVARFDRGLPARGKIIAISAAWLCLLLAAWPWAGDSMRKEYQQLPTHAPEMFD